MDKKIAVLLFATILILPQYAFSAYATDNATSTMPIQSSDGKNSTVTVQSITNSSTNAASGISASKDAIISNAGQNVADSNASISEEKIVNISASSKDTSSVNQNTTNPVSTANTGTHNNSIIPSSVTASKTSNETISSSLSVPSSQNSDNVTNNSSNMAGSDTSSSKTVFTGATVLSSSQVKDNSTISNDTAVSAPAAQPKINNDTSKVTQINDTTSQNGTKTINSGSEANATSTSSSNTNATNTVSESTTSTKSQDELTTSSNTNDQQSSNLTTQTTDENVTTQTTALTNNVLPIITTITPNPATAYQGSQVTFTVTVMDTSSSPVTPTGTVTWNDGGANGSFSSSYCTLSSGSCTITYGVSPDQTSGSVTISASYGGDGVHSVSVTSAELTINPLHNTITTITPNPATAYQGSQVTFTVTVMDTSSSPVTPTGTVTWNDGGANGSFSSSYCTLSSGSCTITYGPSADSALIDISSSYVGDDSHYVSSAKSELSVRSLPSSLLLSTDQSYYAYGDVVSLNVGLPGQSLQNIAVGISDPNGDNIISRTVTTDENGQGMLQFKIPDTYQTGNYEVYSNVQAFGKSYTNSTQFTVIKSHGISIDSVQITNQQGNPISMLKKGQNGFVQVSLSSDEQMPALLTLNLFDANQSSLGTAFVKSMINPGTSKMTLSFFIPSNSQVGLANVFTDAYSDWPGNGGTPLTTEKCLAVDLQDPLAIPVSYVPDQPHSCSSNVNGSDNSTQPVKMTNDQAAVTLGVQIQNDSMTFMDPTQARLLALAYENGTSTKSGDSTIATVTLNLDNASSSNPQDTSSSGNVTTIGPAQFTTLVGPDLQNNPMALKILQEIEISKQQVANILGNETAAKLDQQLILQQRQTAASQLKADLTALEQANAATTSNAAYAGFLATVSDNRTQAVFQDEFNFMKQRVSVANSAMQTVLDNGGSWEEGIQTFNKYATINHVQMVSLNNNLNVQYGLADSRIQSCFDSKGELAVVNGVNPCVANVENNSTGPTGISIISVQPTDQAGNPVTMLDRGKTGYVKVIIESNVSTPSLVAVNVFDSNVASLGTASAQYTLSPGQSEIILPYYVPDQSGTGLGSIYANVFTDWPNNGGVSQSNELSYYVGIW